MAVAPLTQSVGHYENFPVASWLCPARLRPAVQAIYHFARTADDLADEGDAPALLRLEQLAAYRQALQRCAEPPGESNALPAGDVPAWPQVFGPLATALRQHRLPLEPLHDLISAFEQDVRHTASEHRYADVDELLAYTRLSAQPVGRLLLHLYGVHDAEALHQSDQICSALQLINFWQDIRTDLGRGRSYLPQDVMRRHAATEAHFAPSAPAPNLPARAVVAELSAHARGLMMQGAPLVRRVPGRAGWELRVVVQGGLRILDGIAAIDHCTWLTRPRLQKADLPLLLWRALWM
ncbi:MAG: squalene synthase HpnC [Hydrogenophaga sp.]|nr:squalene synthase HpnC [Hydrogenophaga sp.]